MLPKRVAINVVLWHNAGLKVGLKVGHNGGKRGRKAPFSATFSNIPNIKK